MRGRGRPRETAGRQRETAEGPDRFPSAVPPLSAKRVHEAKTLTTLPTTHITLYITEHNNQTSITTLLTVTMWEETHPSDGDNFPSYISCHSAVCAKDKLYVFGGLLKVCIWAL